MFSAMPPLALVGHRGRAGRTGPSIVDGDDRPGRTGRLERAGSRAGRSPGRATAATTEPGGEAYGGDGQVTIAASAADGVGLFIRPPPIAPARPPARPPPGHHLDHLSRRRRPGRRLRPPNRPPRTSSAEPAHAREGPPVAPPPSPAALPPPQPAAPPPEMVPPAAPVGHRHRSHRQCRGGHGRSRRTCRQACRRVLGRPPPSRGRCRPCRQPVDRYGGVNRWAERR